MSFHTTKYTYVVANVDSFIYALAITINSSYLTFIDSVKPQPLPPPGPQPPPGEGSDKKSVLTNSILLYICLVEYYAVVLNVSSYVSYLP